jgi:hypothetical protein
MIVWTFFRLINSWIGFLYQITIYRIAKGESSDQRHQGKANIDTDIPVDMNHRTSSKT